MSSDVALAGQPIFASVRGRRTARGVGLAATALGLGLAVGVATSFGQGRLPGATAALANSESAWLVAPLVVGLAARGRVAAALLGLVCCLAQLVGYDLCSLARGYAVGLSSDLFWGVAALTAGPVLGLAGWLWRRGSADLRGLGPATLSAAFCAEGVWSFGHLLHRPGTTALWLAIAAAVAVGGLRGVRGWRWLALTVPVALLVQVWVG